MRWSSVLLAAVLVAACGGSDDQPDDPRAQVVETVQRFQDAALDGDGEAYCDALTGEGKRKLVTDLAALGSVDCEEVADRALDLAGEDDLAKVRRSRDALDPSDVQIDGQQATALLEASGRRLRLERTEAGWLVADSEAR